MGARYSPNTSRSAPAHSPVVTPARAHSSVAGIRLVSVPASARSRARAAAARSRARRVASRSARQAWTAATAAASTAGSTVWMAVSRSAVSGFGSVVVNALTPDDDVLARTRSAADGRRARRRAPTSCSRTRPPATAPPIACTRSISARAPSTSSATFASTTTDPSNRSSYSSRSDSKASTCWIRSDHCWSHGRGRPSASFHAGSCTARARASLDSVTASISSTMRWTLFSGWASVRPRELTCTP